MAPRKYSGPLRPNERSAYVKGLRKNRPKAPYRKAVPATTKETASKNAKKIKGLEGKVNGHVQRGYHICKLRNNPTGFTWNPHSPILFALNDFYTQTTAPNGGTGAIYYPTFTGTSPNVTTTPQIIDRWLDYTPMATLGLANQYHMWAEQKIAQPSKMCYQPLYTDVTVSIQRAEATPDQGDLWVRCDMFTPKKTYIPQSSTIDPKIYQMPQALGALSNMASTVTQNPNAFNPALFNVKTFWRKLPAVKIATKNLKTRFHIRTGFPKKLLKPHLTVNSGGQGEEFWMTVDPKEVMWCMLSISGFPVADNTAPQVYMNRKTVWRDSQGVEQ